MRVSDGRLEEAGAYLRLSLIPACDVRRAAYRRFGFKGRPLPDYADWVVFGAALTGSPIAPFGTRAALESEMILVAQTGRPFHYTYDWEYGKEQQSHDERVDHLFVSFTGGLEEIEVRRVDGQMVVDRFKSEWGDPIGIDCQPSDAPFDLPFDWVRLNGELVAQFAAGFPIVSGP